MSRLLLLVLPIVAAAALVAAGCGGGGSSASGSASSGGASSSGGSSGNVDTTSDAYEGGFQTCSAGTVAEVADLYGVPQKTPEAVAEVIAEQLSGGSGDQEEVKQGCLDAFAKQS